MSTTASTPILSISDMLDDAEGCKFLMYHSLAQAHADTILCELFRRIREAAEGRGDRVVMRYWRFAEHLVRSGLLKEGSAAAAALHVLIHSPECAAARQTSWAAGIVAELSWSKSEDLVAVFDTATTSFFKPDTTEAAGEHPNADRAVWECLAERMDVSLHALTRNDEMLRHLTIPMKVFDTVMKMGNQERSIPLFLERWLRAAHAHDIPAILSTVTRVAPRALLTALQRLPKKRLQLIEPASLSGLLQSESTAIRQATLLLINDVGPGRGRAGSEQKARPGGKGVVRA